MAAGEVTPAPWPLPDRIRALRAISNGQAGHARRVQYRLDCLQIAIRIAKTLPPSPDVQHDVAELGAEVSRLRKAVAYWEDRADQTTGELARMCR